MTKLRLSEFMCNVVLSGDSGTFLVYTGAADTCRNSWIVFNIFPNDIIKKNVMLS